MPMLPQGVKPRALVSRMLPGLMVAAAALPFAIAITQRALYTPLGRDQGIFQYVAWAMLQGDVAYRDIRDVNGPLTYAVHMVFLLLGGRDDQVFHALDLGCSAAAFLTLGACLPGLGRHVSKSIGHNERGAGMHVCPSWVERIAFAVAAWTVLSVQYLQFTYWDIAQRESFFDWFLLASLGLQLYAHSPAVDGCRRSGVFLSISGLLSVLTWFGKPTFLLFTCAQVGATWLHGRSRPSPRRGLAWFALGGAVAIALGMAFLLRFGDVRSYLSITLRDVPAMYRFIWPKPASDIFAGGWYAERAMQSLAGTTLMLGLIAKGYMPARNLAIALAPIAALVNVIAQAKGFAYHFHPVVAMNAVQWLVLIVWLWERARARSARARDRIVPILAGAALGLHVAGQVKDSPYMRLGWLVHGAATAEQRDKPSYFAQFPEQNYFHWDLRRAAKFLRERTGPHDRVWAYGMDPYVLFHAERRSAAPYIYAYDLNVDAALTGGSGRVPTPAEADVIRAMKARHVEDLLRRLQQSPPAALVFVDQSPLMTSTDAFHDLATQAPTVASWIVEHYSEAASFGVQHVWLRNKEP